MTFEKMKNLPKKEQEKLFKDIKARRQTAKTTLYSATYGAFPPKIARTAKISIEEAKALWETYWNRNWAIKEIAKNVKINKLVTDESMWLYNPVSGFWYSLRYDKDRFSTLNQGTGSYCFDRWLYHVLKRRPQLTAQFHDEGVWCVKKGNRERMESILKDSIQDVNNELKLNRNLDIGIDWGNNYGQIH